MKKQPREVTEKELRAQFLEHIHYLVDGWDKSDRETTKEKLQGLAFSILVMLDGESSLPGFIVAPCPHEDDKQHRIDNGMNYYATNHKTRVKCDIAGNLHNEFYNPKK